MVAARAVVVGVSASALLAVPRITFAFLDVAFGPDRLAVTESGGTEERRRALPAELEGV
jgi:hypothetical protein